MDDRIHELIWIKTPASILTLINLTRCGAT
jgi:hypothetical protein